LKDPEADRPFCKNVDSMPVITARTWFRRPSSGWVIRSINLKVADEEGCDVIVMGTHGKGFLKQTSSAASPAGCWTARGSDLHHSLPPRRSISSGPRCRETGDPMDGFPSNGQRDQHPLGAGLPYLARQVHEIYGRNGGSVLEMDLWRGPFRPDREEGRRIFQMRPFLRDEDIFLRRSKSKLGTTVRVVETDSRLTGVATALRSGPFPRAFFFPSMYRVHFGKSRAS